MTTKRTNTTYDAILIVSFGGPEGMDDVMPFLENVLRGRRVPRERMIEVSHHYNQFGGVSPINDQNRALIAALETALATDGPHLPIYWGNRNWHPLLTDTMEQMAADGVKHALAFFTSMYSCYSGCRQYRENVLAAQTNAGEQAPHVDKIRMAYNHPSFIGANVAHVQDALADIDPSRYAKTNIVFTAHSIPMGMANNSRYVEQLEESCRLVMAGLQEAGLNLGAWQLVYQSRSGAPHMPWLEPDICDHLTTLHEQGVREVAILPIGFISDHMEVLFDLDTEAREVCDELGLTMVRAKTVGTHPLFVNMIRDLIVERMTPNAERTAIGRFGANHDVCPENCCLPR